MTFQNSAFAIGFIIIARKEEEESVHLYCAQTDARRFVFSEKEKYAGFKIQTIQNGIQNSKKSEDFKGTKTKNKTYRIIDVLVRVRGNFLRRWRLL